MRDLMTQTPYRSKSGKHTDDDEVTQGWRLGSQNPGDGPVFDRPQNAITFPIGVRADHFDRGWGLSEARIERFEGMMRMHWLSQGKSEA